MTGATCYCRCHVIAIGCQRAVAHRGNLLRAFGFAQQAKQQTAWGVDRLNPVAAVFACSGCALEHIDVVLGLPYPPRWPDIVELPRPPVYDLGEGAED
jgi:hypothetical protein